MNNNIPTTIRATKKCWSEPNNKREVESNEWKFSPFVIFEYPGKVYRLKCYAF